MIQPGDRVRVRPWGCPPSFSLLPGRVGTVTRKIEVDSRAETYVVRFDDAGGDYQQVVPAGILRKLSPLEQLAEAAE